ncbi:DUF551 domain-containing protein [Sansalvadorimonas verongulae]|uniref:DUF551 domain-containing protein n=1 Tax=Sansalvadorimonas verongulae TaxID=2172824 RepID=UPI0012BBEE5F|nr:DUF551 domain-containing protein [Sansalvadorimonas verongulae]MTI12825.1 DUF551 domain-containing protein [Sansalvadorimonas verongulae]
MKEADWISVNDKLPEKLVEVLVSYGRFKCVAYLKEDENGNPFWTDRESFGEPWKDAPRFWMNIAPEPKST